MHTMALIRERFFWSTMCQEVNNWVKPCKWCKQAKGPHNDPNVKQGSLIANCPLEILCLDFTTMDCSTDRKENILVMRDALSSFTVAVVTPNQLAKTVAKALVNRWFNTYGIPSRIHSDQGKLFDNKIIHHLCTMHGVKQSTTTPYNPHGNSKCERFNWTLHDLLKTLPKSQKTQLVHTFKCISFCLKCNTQFNYRIAAISIDVRTQGPNTLW